MEELIRSGRLIEAIVVLTVLEGLGLAAYHRASGRGVAPSDIWRNLLSGLSLMLALREALVGAWWGWIVACLTASLLAHLSDLQRLWRFGDVDASLRDQRRD